MAQITIAHNQNDGGYGVPDSYMNNFSPTANYGGDTTFYLGAGNAKTTPVRRPWIRFHLGVIPSGSTINSALLRFYAATAAASAELAYVFRCLRTYGVVESEITWNQWKDGENWSAGGGDYYTGFYASFNLPTSQGSFDITGMKVLVDDAIADRDNWLSVIIRRGSESSPDAFIEIISKEESIETQWWPKLIVDYTAPSGNPWWCYHRNKMRRAQ